MLNIAIETKFIQTLFLQPTKKKVNADYYNELEQAAGADPTKLKGKKKKHQVRITFIDIELPKMFHNFCVCCVCFYVKIVFNVSFY